MSDLLIHRHGRVLQLTLNRPQARNALNNALLTQIAEALEAAAVDDSVGVCVIRGNARFFAAGADLNEMAEKDLPATLDDIRPRLWGRIDAFTKPLIASVNGYALGAGRPVYAYTNVASDYRDRVDPEPGWLVEDFGFVDNPMCEGAVRARAGDRVDAGAVLVVPTVTKATPSTLPPWKR